MKHANKNLLLVAAITSLLIMGTSIIPMQSYADNHKKTSDSKSSIKESSQIDKKNANQKMDQDNFCYRDDQCKQGNEGQQIVGKDNEASGFNDQSKTIEQSVTPTPTQASPPPTPKTCEQCFRSVLSAQQIGALNEFLQVTQYLLPVILHQFPRGILHSICLKQEFLLTQVSCERMPKSSRISVCPLNNPPLYFLIFF